MLALLVAASQPLASLGSLQPHPTILGRSGVIAMTMRPPPPPPPPPPLSPALLAADGAVVAGYSISCSLVGLFTSGAYLEPPIVSFQDVIDIAYAFDVAAALSIGWMIASAAVGAASNDWITQDHSASPIGLSRVLPAWLLGWPLGVALKAAAALQFATWTNLPTIVDAHTASMDGAGLLLVVAMYRASLLWWINRW